MAEIGKWNRLEILKELDFGIYLDGEELGEILMPRRYVPKNFEIGDFINAFIYLDSEDRLVTTTAKPYATVGEFAYMRVASVDAVGVFLSWGIMKDLLVPFREQKVKMEKGKSYVVYVYVDEKTNRIAATSKIEKHLDHDTSEYKEEQEVDLLVYKETPLGFMAVVNGRHEGIIYKNEVFNRLRKGDKVKGFIKKIREDGKLDLSIRKAGYEKVKDFSDTLLEAIKEEGGFISITDKSPSEMIYQTFGVSKKTFKKAVGSLYKQRLITLERNGLRSTEL